MSFWNSMRSTSGSGGLNPIVQKVPMPSVMPARASVAAAKPFGARLAAAQAAPSLAAPTAVSKPAPAGVVAPPPAPRPAPVQVQVPPPAPSAELPKASSLDPARLKAALLQAPKAMAPAPVQVPPPPAPMEAVALLRRALVAQARGDHAGAVAEFTAAIALDGKCVEAWTGRGISKEHLGDPDGARRDYAKGIEIEVYAEIDRQRRLPPDLVA